MLDFSETRLKVRSHCCGSSVSINSIFESFFPCDDSMKHTLNSSAMDLYKPSVLKLKSDESLLSVSNNCGLFFLTNFFRSAKKAAPSLTPKLLNAMTLLEIKSFNPNGTGDC